MFDPDSQVRVLRMLVRDLKGSRTVRKSYSVLTRRLKASLLVSVVDQVLPSPLLLLHHISCQGTVLMASRASNAPLGTLSVVVRRKLLPEPGLAQTRALRNRSESFLNSVQVSPASRDWRTEDEAPYREDAGRRRPLASPTYRR